MDCGGSFSAVCMDYDHRDAQTKTGTIGRLILDGSRKKLAEEIEKCDLVCANCHRIRTQARHAAKGSQKEARTKDWSGQRESNSRQVLGKHW